MPAVLFEEESAKRIVDAVKRVEASATIVPVPIRSRAPVPPANFYWTLRGKLNNTLNAGQSAQMQVWFFNPASGHEEAGTGVVTVYDWLLSSGDSIAAGTKVVVSFDL